jgi:hypothetical protein
MDEQLKLPTQNILIEFIGGDADGKYLDSESDNQAESLHAKLIYMGTRNGTVGDGLQTMPMDWQEKLMNNEPFEIRGYSPHQYEVIERLEEGNEIHLRMGYRGQFTPESNETSAG